jgi:hypothetical protein
MDNPDDCNINVRENRRDNQEWTIVTLYWGFLVDTSVLSNVYVTIIWIVHSWLSLRFSLTFMLQSSGLSILDCPFGFLRNVVETFKDHLAFKYFCFERTWIRLFQNLISMLYWDQQSSSSLKDPGGSMC